MRQLDHIEALRVFRKTVQGHNKFPVARPNLAYDIVQVASRQFYHWVGLKRLSTGIFWTLSTVRTGSHPGVRSGRNPIS
jgi:hypothetical protein